jgi:hypothetical protein
MYECSGHKNNHSFNIFFASAQVKELLLNRWNMNIDNDLMQVQGREIGDVSLEIRGKKVNNVNSGFNRALQGWSSLHLFEFDIVSVSCEPVAFRIFSFLPFLAPWIRGDVHCYGFADKFRCIFYEPITKEECLKMCLQWTECKGRKNFQFQNQKICLESLWKIPNGKVSNALVKENSSV